MQVELTDRFLYENQGSTDVYDYMYSKFRKHMALLLEQKKPRKVSAQKGYLNPTKLYKHRFSDNIFQRTVSTPSADTTIIFLIDGSGSMSEYVKTPVGKTTRLHLCGSVAAAFAKANKDVLGGKLKLEVMVKTAPSYAADNLDIAGTGNKRPVFLTRAYSSSRHGTAALQRLLSLAPKNPVSVDGFSDSSYTSEYAVLPILSQWIKKNVSTKNVIVFNLSDGDTYCDVGCPAYAFRNRDTQALRMKYLSGIPNVTLMIDSRYDKNYLRGVYGDNVIEASGDFHNELFRTFARFLD